MPFPGRKASTNFGISGLVTGQIRAAPLVEDLLEGVRYLMKSALKSLYPTEKLACTARRHGVSQGMLDDILHRQQSVFGSLSVIMELSWILS